MLIQFIIKYSSKYFPHKRQACYWSKVQSSSPISLSLIISAVLPVVSQSGVSFISKHNCNCVAILSWQDVNVFIQYPCSPSGPGAFQFCTLCIFFLQFISGYNDVFLLCFYSPFPVFQTTSPGLSETFFERTALLLPHTFLVLMMLPLSFPSVLQSLLSILYLLPYIYFRAKSWFLHYEVHLYSIDLNG